MKELNNVGNIRTINNNPYIFHKVNIRELKKQFENNDDIQLYLLNIQAKCEDECAWYESSLIVPLSHYEDLEAYLDILYKSDENICLIDVIPLSKVSISFDYQSDVYQYRGVHHG